MSAYGWHCLRCGGSQEAAAWRILDVRERPDVIAQLAPGLAYMVCPECGSEAAVEAPILLIRPGNELPLLLAVAASELAELSPLSGQELAREAQTALGRPTVDVVGPMLPLPRSLLPLVLTRDVAADAADPDGAYREICDSDTTLGNWYRAFLQRVNDSEPERRAGRALQRLWGVSPTDLPAFLRGHPELGSAAARTIAARDLAARGPRANSDVLQARLRLVEEFAAGRPTSQVAAEYFRAVEPYGREVNLRLQRLLASINATPGMAGVPQTREALGMAIDLGQDDLEASLSADLASRLLTALIPDSQSIEEAVSLLTRALSLVPSGDPQWPAWAGTLAAAYQRRIIGGPTENWETARDLMDRACAATDRSANPRQWAINQANYGLLLSEHPGGASAEDLARGIQHLQAGLEERSPQANPVDWAYSQLNLGLLYRRRGTGDDLRDAAECYRQGLSHLRPADHLNLWATLQNNLAALLLVADPVDPDAAEAAVRSVLEVIDSSAAPLVGARALWTMGRIEESRHGKLAAVAVSARREALQLLTPASAPELYMRIGGELADAYSDLGDWSKAADVYTGVLTAFGTLYDAQASVRGRREVIALRPRLARWAAYALARAGRPEQAVEVIENGRARQLSIAVARDMADLTRLSAVDPPLADRYQQTLTHYRAALADIAHRAVQTDAQRQIRAAERDIEFTLQQIRAIPGFEGFLQPMSVADICQAGNGDPVIYLVSAPAGSYVLTVRPDELGAPSVDAVAVPEITSTDVVRLVLFDYVGGGAPGLLLAQSTDPLRRIRLLPAALARLPEMQPFARPIADSLALAPGNRAIVIPTGLLGLIPLHAIPMATGRGQILEDLGEIHLAPSAAIFAACRNRASVERHQHLVGVADPENSLPPLPGTRAELASIRDLFEPSFPAICAIGSEATRSWLLQHVEQASHLHLGCHGSSPFGDSSGGKLYLSDDTELTIEDLINGRLTRCRLAVVSACQSGHYSMDDIPDEFIGLPAGFLQAGAACAVVSLWQIDDHATALLMVRFHELLDPGHNTGTPVSPVTALRQARTWLRNLTADQADNFIQAHSPLADLFDQSANEGTKPSDSDLEVSPYAAPQHWAALTAWGY